MIKPLKIILLVAVAACLIAISAVAFHSVEEIHYLKSFYPDSFSVTEAAAAAEVEFIKVLLVALPLSLIVLVCLFLLRLFRKAHR